MKLGLVAVVATAALLGLPAVGSALPQRPLQVVFVAERDGDADVYVANADGTAAAAMTVNRVPDLAAVLSPAGDRVALWRRGMLVIADLRAGTSRAVARGTPLAWSPDGRLLAFSDARTGGLSVVPASGRGVRRLTRGSRRYAGVYDLSWSGDAHHLTFDSADGDMFVVDVQKGTRRHYDVYEVMSAAWSGRRFSYINDNKSGGSDLIVRDARARVLRRVHTNFFSSEFSPDGKRIAWDGLGAKPGVYVGVGLHRPRRASRVEPLGDTHPYAWSPDSTEFAFVAGRRAARAVWVAKADGSTVRRLGGTAGASAALPMWSPDSRELAFVRSGELDVIRADGARPVTVLVRGRRIRVLGWRAARTSASLAPVAAPRGPEVARGHVLFSRGPVSELAAAGSRVAYLVPATGMRDLCEHVGVWDVATGKVVRFRTPCSATENTTFYALDFDGEHAEWSGIEWHNDAYESGGHASLSDPRHAVVVHGQDLGSNSDVRQPVKHVEVQKEFGYTLRPARGGFVLRRLRDRRTASVHAPTPMADAVLASAGVFYTYDVAGAQRGRIAFVRYTTLFR